MYFLGLTVPARRRARCAGPTSAGCSPTRRCSARALMLVADVIGRVLVRPGRAAGRRDARRRSARRCSSRSCAASGSRRCDGASRRARRGPARPRRARRRRASRCASGAGRSSSSASLVVVVLALFVVAIGTGDFPIAPGDVVAALLGGGDAGTALHRPRPAPAARGLRACSSASRSRISGAVFQSLTRNPLGSPDIVGFPQGASVGALIVITVLAGSGAAVSARRARRRRASTALAVYGLAFKRGGTSGYRLDPGRHRDRLPDAVDHRLPARARAHRGGAGGDALAARLAQRPQLGRRRAARCRRSRVLLPAVVPAGRGAARARAGRRRRARRSACASSARGWGWSALAVGLVSITTVAVGPIGFVALTAPQIARRLAHAAGPPLVCSALTGAVDRAGRGHRRPAADPRSTPLPVGVMTGAFGGLYLAWLLTSGMEVGTRDERTPRCARRR